MSSTEIPTRPTTDVCGPSSTQKLLGEPKLDRISKMGWRELRRLPVATKKDLFRAPTSACR